MSEQAKKWVKAAAIRALKTMAQAAGARIGSAVLLSDVSWPAVISTAMLAGIGSLLMSIKGLPEADAPWGGVK